MSESQKFGQVRVEQAVPELPYRLAASRVVVRGTLRVVEEPAGSTVTADAVTVELEHAGDTAAPRTLRTGQGSQDLGVELTADGRLRSLTYQRVGAGPAVVSAGARLIGFLGSVALRFVTGRVAGGGADRVEGESGGEDQNAEAWLGEEQLSASTALADRADTRLRELRERLLDAETPSAARELEVLVRAASTTLEAARDDVARLSAQKAAWLAAQRRERTAAIAATVPWNEIGVREPGRPVAEAPEPPREGPGVALWEDFRLVLEVVDPRRSAGASAPAATGREDRTVRWRMPREVELWVWRAGSSEGQEDVLELVSRAPVRIVDALSDVAGLELREGAFGEHGLSLTFDDDGAPLSVSTSDKGAASALAAALGGAPEALVGGVTQAQELVKGIDELRDAADARAQAALERELAMATTRNQLLGVHATEAQAARLARLQQRVELSTARRGASAEARALLDLQDDLAEATARNSLESARRTGEVESDLAGLRAEVARLEAEVARARARWEIEHPGDTAD